MKAGVFLGGVPGTPTGAGSGACTGPPDVNALWEGERNGWLWAERSRALEPSPAVQYLGGSYIAQTCHGWVGEGDLDDTLNL